MLPIVEPDFAALCGIEGDFFGAERRQIRAQTYAFDPQKLPRIGTLDSHFCGLVARGFARRPLKSPVLICYAAMPDFVMLHVCSRRRVRLSWLQRATELETKVTHVAPHTTPFLLWNGADLTRLHPLPVGESPHAPRVEDFGNPFGVVSERVPRAQWKRLRANLWNTDYSPVPMEEEETISEGVVLKHVFFRVAEEAC